MKSASATQPSEIDIVIRTSTSDSVVVGQGSGDTRTKPAVEVRQFVTPPNASAPLRIVTSEPADSRSSQADVKTVSASGLPMPPSPVPDSIAAAACDHPCTPPGADASRLAVKMVRSKHVPIKFEVKDVGPSGIGSVELWYTRDGREWHKSGSTTQAQPPYVVEVEEDGRYGFTMVARNGTGMSKESPHPGDTPQIWVEVDTTKPTVYLASAEPGTGAKSPNVTVRWSASDKNLGVQPITLSYAEQADGPWIPFATAIENTGKFVWEMPPTAPHQFFVRVEATDMAGNAAAAQTPTPVVIDMSLPTVSILGVEGGK